MTCRIKHFACLLVVVLLPSAARGDVTINGPDRVPPGEPAWFVITPAVGSESVSVSFFPSDYLTVGAPHLRDGHALFWTRSPGTYLLHGIAVDWAAQRFSIVQHKVVVAEIDPPDPPLPPEPDPPAPGAKRQVMFLYESSKMPSLNDAQRAMVAGLRFRESLAERGHRLIGSFDVDLTGPAGDVPAPLASWFRAGAGKAPCVLLAPMDGGEISVHPLPDDEAGFWRLLGEEP